MLWKATKTVYDPEQNTGGYFVQPTWSFGANLNF